VEEIGGDLRGIDPFGPQTRHDTQSVVYRNYGCGAGNLVCSISVSGDVNPCSFLGSSFNAANLRERSLEEIWHESHGFRTIRALPGPVDEAFETPENHAVFSGGCRARALYFNGSINAPDPWCTDQKAAVQARSQHQEKGPAVHHPLVVLEIPAARSAS
jgi:radical SAM protein with 4Fe4S-binding SPASM domain